MRVLLFCVSVSLWWMCSGCIADMRPAIDCADRHLGEIVEVARARPDLAEPERLELVDFHASRGRAWTSAMLRHKGAPEQPVEIPRTPLDARGVRVEDIALERYQADVETERRVRDIGRGLLGKVLGGAGGLAGGGGLLALVKLVLDKRRLSATVAEKDRAIDDYDRAVEKLPPPKRREIATGEALRREHELRRAPPGAPA